jgi:hypothetical protein
MTFLQQELLDTIAAGFHPGRRHNATLPTSRAALPRRTIRAIGRHGGRPLRKKNVWTRKTRSSARNIGSQSMPLLQEVAPRTTPGIV